MLGKEYTIDYRGPKSIYGCVCGQLVVRNTASKLCRSDTVLETVVKRIVRICTKPQLV